MSVLLQAAAIATGLLATTGALALDNCAPDHFQPRGAHYGNGGGTVVQRAADGSITQAFVLDYWEHQINQDGFIPDLGAKTLPVAAKIDMVLERWARLDPLKAALYRNYYATFDAEACYIGGIRLEPIDDAHNIGYPDGVGWAFEQAAVQVDPVLPTDRRYTIAKDIWDRLDNDSRAGLILHEIMYRDALRYGATTSIGVRYMNAAGAADAISAWDVQKYVQIAILEGMGSANVQGLWLDLNANAPLFWPNGNLKTGFIIDDENAKVPSPWGTLDLYCAVWLTEDGQLQDFSPWRNTNATVTVGGHKLRIYPSTPAKVTCPRSFSPEVAPMDAYLTTTPDVGPAVVPTVNQIVVTGRDFNAAAAGRFYFKNGVLQDSTYLGANVAGNFVEIAGQVCGLLPGHTDFGPDGVEPTSGTLSYCELPTTSGLLKIQGSAHWIRSNGAFVLRYGTLAADVGLTLNRDNAITAKIDTGLIFDENGHVLEATVSAPAHLVDAKGQHRLFGPGASINFDANGYVAE